MPLALIFLIGSALLHPFWIALPKKAAHPLTMNFWGMVIATIIFSPVYFQTIFWEKVIQHKELVLSLVVIQSFYAMSVLVFARNHHFQLAYPLSRTIPIVVLIGEVFFLNETFTPLQIIGICTVAFGALLFGIDEHIRKIRIKFFLLLSLVTIAGASAMLLTKKLIFAFDAYEFWAFSLFQLPILIIPVLFLKKQALQDIKNVKLLFGSSIAMIGTWYLGILALEYFPAAVVSAVRSLSILFGIFLGGQMFYEGHAIKRYIAGGMIAMGAILSLI